MRVKKTYKVTWILIIILIIGRNAGAFWPWQGEYIAKVNGEIISKDDFKKKLEGFHTVKDIGEKMNVDMDNVAYRQILNDMIDDRLMIREALSIGLDKNPGFIYPYNLFKLNKSLSLLRKEEVMDKVEVSKEEILDRFIYDNESVWLRYIITKDKKKGEALLKALRKGADFSLLAEKESEAPEAVKKKGGDIGFKKRGELHTKIAEVVFSMKVGDISGLIRTKTKYYIFRLEKKKVPTGNISERERHRTKRTVFMEKETDRNREFIELLRKTADVTREEAVIKSLKRDDESGGEDIIIATVKGEPVIMDKLLKRLRSYPPPVDEEEWERNKISALDSLIRQKLLDMEALARNYEKEDSFQDGLPFIKNSLLIKLFKSNIAGAAVKVDVAEIKKYYEDNEEEFRDPDNVRLSIIRVYKKEKAADVMKELDKGADFGVLASSVSEDRNTSPKGDTGWISSNLLPPDIRKKMDEMETGGVYGPFNLQRGFLIVKLNGKRVGNLREFDGVRDTIITTLRKKKYNHIIQDYLERLRSASDITINEPVLKSFIKKNNSAISR